MQCSSTKIKENKKLKIEKKKKVIVKKKLPTNFVQKIQQIAFKDSVQK